MTLDDYKIFNIREEFLHKILYKTFEEESKYYDHNLFGEQVIIRINIRQDFDTIW